MVSFHGENANSVVPVKLIGYSKVGDKCDVVWPNDQKKYSGTVIALGTEQEMNSVLDDDIDDDDDNDGGVDSGGTDELLLIVSVNGVIYILPIGDSCIASEECDEDLVQQCSKKRKYAVKPHPPSEKPHPSSEKPHPPSEKPHPPSEKPHPPSEKLHLASESCTPHPGSHTPHMRSHVILCLRSHSIVLRSQKSNTDKIVASCLVSTNLLVLPLVFASLASYVMKSVETIPIGNMLGSIPWWVLYPGGGLLLLVITAFLLFSLYVAYIHWKYSHIPSPKRNSFFLGHIQDFQALSKQTGNEFVPLATAITKWAEQVGDLFVTFMVFNPLVISCNPDDLKDLLVKFNECGDTFLERLRPHADGKTEVSMKEAFHEATLDAISKAAFSLDFNNLWNSKSLGLKYTTNATLSHLASTAFKGVQTSFIFPLPILFPLLHPREAATYREAVTAMRRIGRDCIEKRIKAVTCGEEVPNDILTQILQTSIADRNIDMEILVDDFVTFYEAGQDTTANTLSFAIILIHQHPEVLDRLLSEIADVLGDRKEVTADDLDKLKYTEQVIQEVLRMYPPAASISKELPKGGMFSTAVMCRNPEYFNDPDTFDPSRFDADKIRPGPFVYFPFGVGHRSCIGRHFAMIEAKVILTRLLQTFKVTLPPTYMLVVEQKITQQPKGDVLCTLLEIVH
ncbi:hypothetical protein EMCRGX_G028268 [Ephydatia muelleri]